MNLARLEVLSRTGLHFTALSLQERVCNVLEDVLLNCVTMVDHATAVLPHTAPVTHVNQIHSHCSH